MRNKGGINTMLLISLFFFLLYIAVLFPFPMLKSWFPLLYSWFPNGKGSGKSSGQIFIYSIVFQSVFSIKYQSKFGAGFNMIQSFSFAKYSFNPLSDIGFNRFSNTKIRRISNLFSVCFPTVKPSQQGCISFLFS